MKNLFWTLFVAIIAIATSCNPVVDPGAPELSSTVQTTITGCVTDEAGKSVAGALVKGHGKTTTTNNNGVFVLSDVVVPSTRAVVIVSKGGYFTGARAAYPSASKTTTMLLTLQQAKQTRTISAASGGQVAVGAATVDLPANGYVDAQGNAYTGTVSVAARYLDPTDDNFYDSFSGDMAALRMDGSSTELISYGVLRVKLTGSQGQPLNLRQGASATLTYPASGATDVSIPLWYFDETRGIWVEEGTATRVGGNYVGTVTHFTDWNLDVPGARVAFIEGRVTCGEDTPLAGIVVDVGQVTAVTDQDGKYRRRVPADFTFNVEIKGSRNDGISASPVSVGPISQNQTLRKDIVVSSCPTLLQAQIVGCDDKPVGGFVHVITPNGVKIASSITGKILVAVPGATALTLEGYSTEGLVFASTPVAAIPAGTTFDAGYLKACNGVTTQYLDIPLPDGETARLVALNGDGSRVAVVTDYNIHVYDAATGTKQWSTDIGAWLNPTSLRFTAGDRRLALSEYSGTTVFDAATGQTVGQVNVRGWQHITADGALVYVVADRSTTGSIVEYDATSGVMRRTISISGQPRQFEFIGLQGDNFAIIQRYSPFVIQKIDLATGVVVRTYNGLSDSTGVSDSAALSPSGNTVVLYSWDRGTAPGLAAVDLLTGTIISRFQTQEEVLAISPDDAEYVSRMYTQAGALPTLMTLRTQQLKRVLPWIAQSQSYMPDAFTFSGDGSRLAGAASDGAGANRVRVYTLK